MYFKVCVCVCVCERVNKYTVYLFNVLLVSYTDIDLKIKLKSRLCKPVGIAFNQNNYSVQIQKIAFQ